jgi:hypothetical protein
MSASASAPPNEGYQQDRGIPATSQISCRPNSIRNFALRSVVEVLHQELPAMRRHLTIRGSGSGPPFQPALRERIVLR